MPVILDSKFVFPRTSPVYDSRINPPFKKYLEGIKEHPSAQRLNQLQLLHPFTNMKEIWERAQREVDEKNVDIENRA
jgi:hypothetical protein